MHEVSKWRERILAMFAYNGHRIHRESRLAALQSRTLFSLGGKQSSGRKRHKQDGG